MFTDSFTPMTWNFVKFVGYQSLVILGINLILGLAWKNTHSKRYIKTGLWWVILLLFIIGLGIFDLLFLPTLLGITI